MPIPVANDVWPPLAVADIYADYEEADAWYSGDKTRLTKLYGNRAARTREEWHEYVHRLWAQERDLTTPETRLHIPLAGDIAATSADLLFSEPPAFTVDKTAQDRLDEILDEGGAHMRLLEAAEVDAGIGDVYLKLAWDEDVAKRPILAVEHGDAAIPTFRWGRLVEVTFWQELEHNGSKVIRLLEHHEPGFITYAVYEGNSTNLGTAVPLADREDTKRLDAITDDQGRQATGIGPLLTATHVPNMRPNRKHRGRPYGRSDYAAPCYDQFDALDQVWTSWMRDIRLGRARLIVPAGYLQSQGPGQGATFNADREIWSELNMDPSQLSGGGITMNQFSIRVAEHKVSAEELVRLAAQAAGYSAQSFGLHGDGSAPTATEVGARKERSMITRGRKAQYWIPALKRITEAMLALDKALGWSTFGPLVPTVEFPDAVSQEAESLARTIKLMRDAEAASTDTLVRMAHPDWDEPKVAAEVRQIIAESGNGTDPIEKATGAVRDAFPGQPAGQQPAQPPGPAPAGQ